MKKYIKQITVGTIILIALVCSYFMSGKPVANTDQPVKPTEKTEIQTDVSKDKNEIEIPKSETKDEYKTDPVPDGKPKPQEPQETEVKQNTLVCTLSVRCDTLLNNLSDMEPEKAEIVPDDGVIYAKREVEFNEGESVFDVLLREMRKNNIHLEFENTPVYNSAYIEGIANLYEFDCGELSGWMYKVNDWFPNYGCSRYVLKNGDKIEWVYTCDLGKDVGGGYEKDGQ